MSLVWKCYRRTSILKNHTPSVDHHFLAPGNNIYELNGGMKMIWKIVACADSNPIM